MESIDLRECQHDPPCGSPVCTACELLRVDRELRDMQTHMQSDIIAVFDRVVEPLSRCTPEEQCRILSAAAGYYGIDPGAGR